MAGGGYIVSNRPSDLVGLAAGIGTASIVIGVIVTLISFFGCFGAANEKGILLKTYFVILCIIIVLEMGVGIAAYSKRDSIPEALATAWKEVAQRDPVVILKVENTVWYC
jgi:hypothetical protein